jgi:hypothetical protein
MSEEFTETLLQMIEAMESGKGHDLHVSCSDCGLSQKLPPEGYYCFAEKNNFGSVIPYGSLSFKLELNYCKSCKSFQWYFGGNFYIEKEIINQYFAMAELESRLKDRIYRFKRFLAGDLDLKKRELENSKKIFESNHLTKYFELTHRGRYFQSYCLGCGNQVHKNELNRIVIFDGYTDEKSWNSNYSYGGNFMDYVQKIYPEWKSEGNIDSIVHTYLLNVKHGDCIGHVKVSKPVDQNLSNMPDIVYRRWFTEFELIDFSQSTKLWLDDLLNPHWLVGPIKM